MEGSAIHDRSETKHTSWIPLYVPENRTTVLWDLNLQYYSQLPTAYLKYFFSLG